MTESPIDRITHQATESQVVEILRTCYDPEIPVNIYDLGLIYEVNVENEQSVHVKMTLTSPMCPVAGSLPGEVESRIKNGTQFDNVNVELVWDPPWTPEKMTEAARLQLNI